MDTEFITPDNEIQELVEMLEGGKLRTLRDWYPQARRTRQPLERYTSRIWLFPFGVRPSSESPVQIWRNGLVQHLDHEVKLLQVGRTHLLTIVVFQHPTRDGDIVQADYLAVPAKNT